MPISRPAKDIQLNTRQGRLAALHWPCADGPRVLCLHGWLDNAASFVPLAPLLDGLDLIAIDLPGHGHSEHRHSTTRYHFIDYLFNVDAALDELGWSSCHLLGHSLGAAIASAYAAGAPERVRSIVLLDSMGPVSVSAETTTERLRRSLVKNRRGTGVVRDFDSIDHMVKARCLYSGMHADAARLICERGVRKAGGKFRWRSDPALNWVSSLVMTDEQALDLVSHITAPTLTFTATPDSPWASRDKLEKRRKAIDHGVHKTVDGHHHFHMDDPAEIAEPILQFIFENDQTPDKGSA
jgi:pimeloyl-ACP methyl ester carboxylesterase